MPKQPGSTEMFWVDVPDDAIITEPNKASRTIPMPRVISNEESNVTVSTRCFMPRSMTQIGNARAGARHLNWLAVVRLILQVAPKPLHRSAWPSKLFWNLKAVRPDQQRLPHFSEARTAKFTIKEIQKELA